jgi:hypothetical protein
MNIALRDLGGITEPGRYPLRDGSIDVLAIETAHWKRDPEDLFRLMRKNPVRGQIEYVLGEIVPAGVLG